MGGRQILNDANGAPHLTTAIEGALGKDGKPRPGSPRVLEITVTELRLRSGATVCFAGTMAGVDTLPAHTTVREGGAEVTPPYA